MAKVKVEVFNCQDVELRNKTKLTSLYVGLKFGEESKKTKSHTTKTKGEVEWKEIVDLASKKPNEDILKVSLVERHRTSADVDLVSENVPLRAFQSRIPKDISLDMLNGKLNLRITYIPLAEDLSLNSSFSGGIREVDSSMYPLVIRNISCSELMAADKRLIGKSTSDPYVEFRVGQTLVKTKRIEKDLSPKFSETFEIRARGEMVINCQVKDHDHVGTDDDLGEAWVKLPQDGVFIEQTVTKVLQRTPRMKEHPTGTITFTYSFGTRSQGVDEIAQRLPSTPSNLCPTASPTSLPADPLLVMPMSTSTKEGTVVPTSEVPSSTTSTVFPEPVINDAGQPPSSIASSDNPRLNTLEPPHEIVNSPRDVQDPPPTPNPQPVPPPCEPDTPFLETVATPSAVPTTSDKESDLKSLNTPGTTSLSPPGGLTIASVPSPSAPPAPTPAPAPQIKLASSQGTGAPGTLRISTVEVVNIAAADRGFLGRKSTSDPYIKITVGPHAHKTKTHKNTLNSRWDEEITLKNVKGGSVVLIEVFDEDIGKDEFLGGMMLQIPAVHVAKTENFPITGCPIAAGHLNISYSWSEDEKIETSKPDSPKVEELKPSVSLAHGPIAPSANKPAEAATTPGDSDAPKTGKGDVLGCVLFSEFAAYGLRAADRAFLRKPSSDPYVRVALLGENGGVLCHAQTAVLKGTLNPKWGDPIQLPLTGKARTVRVEVFDKDKLGKDDPLGQVIIPVEKDGGEIRVEQKLQTPIGSKKQAQGSITFMLLTRMQPQTSNAGGSAVSTMKLVGCSFGKLRFSSITAHGLRKADINVLSFSRSSDPYVKVVMSTEFGIQEVQTETKYRTTTPVYDQPLELDIYERGAEIIVEVFDEDISKGDDSLGRYIFALPDASMAESIEAQLSTAPNTSHEAKGVIRFSYSVEYDDELEWKTAFQTIPPSASKERKRKAPEFSLGVTKDSVNQILSHIQPCMAALNGLFDLFNWVNPVLSGLAVSVFTVICWYSLFIQAFVIGFGVFYAYQYLLARGSGYGAKSKAARSPTKDGASSPSSSNDMAGLGYITQLAFTVAYWAEWTSDLLTWKYSSRSQPVAYAIAAGFILSCFIPFRFFTWIAGLYMFTLNAMYTRYPLFRRRYPIARLIVMSQNKVRELLGLKPISGQRFQARVSVMIVKANNVKNTDRGILGLGANASDPYCLVSIADKQLRTRTVNDTLNPVWNQQLDPFLVSGRNHSLRIQIFDHDDTPINEDEFLGEATVAIIGPLAKTEVWLDLKPRKGLNDNFITGAINIIYSVDEIKYPVSVGPQQKKIQ